MSFKGPKPQPPTPPPTIDQAKVAAEANDRLSKRQSRAATYVSTDAGRKEGGVGAKMLMGQGG